MMTKYELNKILLQVKPSIKIYQLISEGILQEELPELYKCYNFEQNTPFHNKDVLAHILTVVDCTECKLELRLAALFHDIGKPEVYSVDEKGVGHFYQHEKVSARICRNVMKRLGYKETLTEYVAELVFWHMSLSKYNKEKSVKKFINNIGEDKLDDLFKLKVNDCIASNPPFNLEPIFRLKFACEKLIQEDKKEFAVKDLDIKGRDLLLLGVPQGKEIGNLLSQLKLLVESGRISNEKEKLLEYLKANM